MIETADVRPIVLTAQQLADRWQIHPKTIQRHVRMGTFPIPPLLRDARALRFALVLIERHERGEFPKGELSTAA